MQNIFHSTPVPALIAAAYFGRQNLCNSCTNWLTKTYWPLIWSFHDLDHAFVIRSLVHEGFSPIDLPTHLVEHFSSHTTSRSANFGGAINLVPLRQMWKSSASNLSKTISHSFDGFSVPHLSSRSFTHESHILQQHRSSVLSQTHSHILLHNRFK